MRSQSSRRKMVSKSSLDHSIQGCYRSAYGGAIIPEPNAGQQQYYKIGKKKSKVRLNDQLIPKPTDINMGEKMIKTATPKEHPYSSHMCQFAIFPSFRSPDDPETGVRAASQPFLNPLIPNRAPDVTLLSKTMGGPYRQEIVETPMKTRKKAVRWTGERGFLDLAKPLKGENQVFYPTPPKTVLPNPKLRKWDLSLSERTSNMLKNLEKTHWVTSYQMQYTGSGPANPIKVDDFKEKLSDLTGMSSHAAPLRERSFPVFVPSEPRGGCRRRQGRSTCNATAAELSNPSPAPTRGAASATINQYPPQEITAEQNEAPDPIQKGHSPSYEVSLKRQTESRSSAHEGGQREDCGVQSDESPMQVSVSQSSREADTERPLDLYSHSFSQGEMEVNRGLRVKDEKEYFKAARNVSSLSQPAVAKYLAGLESHAELLSRASEQEERSQCSELPHTISNGRILPRPPVLTGIRPVDRAGTAGALSLLDLQNSFSKSTAHRNFNSSVTRAAVNLRDSVVTGKKHDFYGINCYYLHG